MKKSTQNLILTSLILGCSLLVLKLSTQHFFIPKSDFIFADFKEDDIKKISISSPKSTILLNRKETKWVLDKHTPANSKKVDQIIQQIRDLKQNQLVSKTNNQTQYNINTNNISIKVSTGIKSKTILIGKQGPSWHSTYFQTSDSYNIYLTDQALHYSLNIEKNDYINLYPLKMDLDSIQDVSLNIDKKNQSFSRIDNHSWKLNKQETTTLNHQIITAKVTYINNILAKTITENIKLSIDNSIANIAIKKSDNDQIILNLYQAGQNYFLKSSLYPELTYVISEDIIKQLNK